jgi:TatD DNase family protein
LQDLLTDLIDIGANLTHQSFAADLPEVLSRAFAHGVARLMVTGADLAGSHQALALARSHAGRLWSTAGVHPHHAKDFDAHTAAALEVLLADAAVVAVGECGLDYHRNFSPPDAQRSAFEAQLKIAERTGKPLFLHERDAHEDFISMLGTLAPARRRGVAHCFTGGPAELEAYLDLGLYIGVTGWVCDERRGAQLREAVPRIPAERLLLETDAPYLLPRDLQAPPKSRRNEPYVLAHVAARVAALRGESLEEVATRTSSNAEALFGLVRGS